MSEQQLAIHWPLALRCSQPSQSALQDRGFEPQWATGAQTEGMTLTHSELPAQLTTSGRNDGWKLLVHFFFSVRPAPLLRPGVETDHCLSHTGRWANVAAGVRRRPEEEKSEKR